MMQVLIAIDQLANTLCKGMADETLSARAYRWQLTGRRTWPRRVIDGLFFWDRDHCQNSWLSEMQRKQLPRHYRRDA